MVDWVLAYFNMTFIWAITFKLILRQNPHRTAGHSSDSGYGKKSPQVYWGQAAGLSGNLL